ncbi:MAG TPA: acetyl-CoA carboxylase carboxyltransferase subunit alpha [Blastocatellia bacterium]|nr:acetyl-CoA carboxylase carboxyltransferase subunit alpha [Blastocatellia bacterium]
MKLSSEEEPSMDEPIDEIHRRLQESDAANLTADPVPLSAWDRVKLARHPERPYTLDYIKLIFTDFTEIHGDRRFGDDSAIVAGFARFQGEPCVVVGHQKGRDTKQRQKRNFGMPKPEGYRKALRVMKLAEKFGRPIFTFIDTPGAYPGIDAEERGQAEAIAYNLREMAKLRVPIIVTVTGEGGSGGALAIGLGDSVLMLENAIYSVISPEGCASILWRDASYAEQAARALRLTAPDLLEFGLIDQIVPEPKGGAHTDHGEMGNILEAYLADALQAIRSLGEPERIARRYEKFRAMGEFEQQTV